MICPRDQSVLTEISSDEYKAHSCPDCHGIFLPLNQSQDSGLSFSQVKPTTRARIPVAKEERALSPMSGQAMLLFRFRGVQIDYCSSANAVWLDSGELDKIANSSTVRKRGKAAKKWIVSEDILDGIDAGLTANADSIFEFIGEAVSGIFDGL